MSQSAANIPNLNPDTLEALAAYDAGSSRAALCPLDRAVEHALPNPEARAKIETVLIAMLAKGPSTFATEYICSKLALLGSAACVPALAGLLGDSHSSAAARNALERIPGDASLKALRSPASVLQGTARIGVIRSLGVRCDADSVKMLAELLKESDPQTAAACACALGEAGTPKAAAALKQTLATSSGSLKAAATDAAFACAEHLLAAGRRSDAKSLYGALLKSTQLPHVREAASRALESRASGRTQRAGTS